MVGVPRSKGCQICLQRRVKCDETRPACKRCEARGQKCPGYEKARKFCHFPLPTDQHQNSADSGPRGQVAAQPHKRTFYGSALHRWSSIDETVAPNLAHMALDVQQKEVFGLTRESDRRTEINSSRSVSLAITRSRSQRSPVVGSTAWIRGSERKFHPRELLTGFNHYCDIRY
ncbi:hypothetical protein V1524DRAFT_371398 [Lipomyces starkeyi]